MSKTKLKYNHAKNRQATERSVGRVSDHRRELSDLVFRVAESKSVKALVQRRTQVQGRLSKMLNEIAALRYCFDQQIGDKIKDYTERETLAAAQAEDRRIEREAAKTKKEAEKAEAAKAKKLKTKARKLMAKAKAKKASKPKAKDTKADPAILAHAMNANRPWPFPNPPTTAERAHNAKPDDTVGIADAQADLKALKKGADAQPKAKVKSKKAPNVLIGGTDTHRSQDADSSVNH